ncbi:transcription factor UNE10-like isoform X2 [Actinidia eriantha]|uniref:transcription factor UNE10-like isoform X2 n=1 Tax=Actinidia eriantha TaxID=165200 RepID=UPI00258A5DFC|nr:transcription factor UNE10-like isoform X2 [Actinidia eriantha]
MSQCVPTWDLDEIPNPLAPLVPMLGGEVAELPWEKDQVARNGLGPPCVYDKPLATSSPTKNTWGERPGGGGGTLESVVKQATRFRHSKPTAYGGGNDVASCLDRRQAAATGDALVPCAAAPPGQRIGMCGEGSSARVGSCSGSNTSGKRALKRAKVARVPVAHVCSSCDDGDGDGGGDGDSDSESGRDSWRLSRGSSEWELGSRGFASSSIGLPESTCSDEWSTEATTRDDRDTRELRAEEREKKARRRFSLSTRRTFGIDSQSELRRREKINKRMKTLQQMVPNSSKIDKVSMLDEVIEHLKQLQAQVVMMSRMMNMSYMMLPMALQQHLQLSLMASMGMGMRMGSGMGMGVMDINAATGFPNITTGISPVPHPAAYLPLISWDRSGDCFSTPTMVVPDPVSTFLACQAQPTMDGYSRMASLYQQLHLPLLPGFNN